MESPDLITFDIVVADGQDAAVWAERVGELIADRWPNRRHWWQFWRPRHDWWACMTSALGRTDP